MARGAKLVTIFWRDIPAQVNAKTRSEKHRVLLKPRFQKAIDRAAMVADKTEASAYVAEWRQESMQLAGDPKESAEAEAARLDAAFPLSRLDQLAKTGGWNPDTNLEESSDQ